MTAIVERNPIVLPTDAIPNPLRVDEDGVVRVGPTRVTLDSVLIAYQSGERAEDIIEMYPSLRLADVHAVLAYYLQHRAEVDAWLAKERELAAAMRRKVEEMFPLSDDLRERMRVWAREHGVDLHGALSDR